MSLPKPFYQDDFATVYCGDCKDILPQLPPSLAVVSDPPYGMDWDTDCRRFSGGHNAKKRGGGNRLAIAGDSKPFDPSPFLTFESVILFGFNHFASSLPRGTTLVWLKRNDEAFGTFLSDAELAWMKGGHGVYCKRDLSMNGEALTRAHPSQKPLPLMAWCMSFVPESQTILDPFMGSGTTLVAAKQLGRKAIGIELEEKYCEIAAKRLQQEYLPLTIEPTPQMKEQSLL